MKCLLFLFTASLTSVINHSHGEQLDMEKRTLTEVRACFYDGDRTTSKRGICVQSTPSSVLVKKLGGDIILRHVKKGTGDSLQLGNHKFIKYEGLKKFHRSISPKYEEDDVGEIVDADNKDLERAAREVLEGDHIDLLERMARALGSEGIYGHEYEGVLPFYTVAKRFSGLAKDMERKKRKRRGIFRKVINDHEDTEMDGLIVDKINDEAYMESRPNIPQENDVPITSEKSSPEGKGFQDIYRPGAQDIGNNYPNHDLSDEKDKTEESDNSTCPPNPKRKCLGLCGYGCSCWEFLCGDCCWHLGCYQHDLCCRASMWSWACLFPFSFTCDNKFPKYPECLD